MRPDLLISAMIEEGMYDDHIQVEIGGENIYTSPKWYTGPCELNTSWCLTTATQAVSPVKCTYPDNVTGGSIDVTSHFKTTEPVFTNIKVKVGDVGEGYVRVRLLYGSEAIINNPEDYCLQP